MQEAPSNGFYNRLSVIERNDMCERKSCINYEHTILSWIQICTMHRTKLGAFILNCE